MTPEQEGRLLDGVDDIRDRLLRIEAACGPCQLMVRENREAIRGNGKIGLVTEMAVHSQVIEELRLDSRKNTRWMQGLIATIITSVLGMLGYVLRHSL